MKHTANIFDGETSCSMAFLRIDREGINHSSEAKKYFSLILFTPAFIS
jgi:hypothetical protein